MNSVRKLLVFVLKPKFVIAYAVLLIIFIMQHFPVFIEKYYSTGIYPFLAKLARLFTTWLPFSIGDILYVVCILYCLVWLFLLVKKIIYRDRVKAFLFTGLGQLGKNVLKLVIVFYLFWGLNYNRLGIGHQLNITTTAYSKEDLEALVCYSIDKLNLLRKQIADTALPSRNVDITLQHTISLYDSVKHKYPFLAYQHPSLKKSLFSSISHYVGFTGYYNPFSGEAQLTTAAPDITLPIIAAHEIAHQLGYALEDEANFVGFLVCKESKDVFVQYSAWMDIYKYATYELLMKDFKSYHGWQLDAQVRKDLRAIRNYYASKENNVSPYMNQLYAAYLKANNQIEGLDSYNKVVDLLISHQKKYGHY